MRLPILIFTLLTSLLYSTPDKAYFAAMKSINLHLRNKAYSKANQALTKMSEFDNYTAAIYLQSQAKRYKDQAIVTCQIFDLLNNFKNEKFVNYLKRSGLRGERCDPFIFSLVVERKFPECRPIFNKIIKKGKVTSSFILSIKGLAKYNDLNENELQLLFDLCTEKNQLRVRKQAITALGEIDKQSVVDQLIKYVQDPTLDAQVLNSLERLTGKSDFQGVDDWSKWWNSNRDSVKLSRTALSQLRKKREEKVIEKTVTETGQDNYFFGLKLKGEKILFVLDRSGSMSGKPLTRLKEELMSFIEQMPEKNQYGIIFFSSNNTKHPRTGLSKATQSANRKTKKFVDRITATGSTALASAMELAFKTPVAKDGVDTIYLLSDGEPNTIPEQIRQIIIHLNRDYNVTIHTLSLGRTSKFLQNVANDHNGHYAEIVEQ